jgi:hypothetical protein
VLTISVWLGATVLGIGCKRDVDAPPQGPPLHNTSDIATLTDFKKRIDDYVALHQKVEGGLPNVPKEATPKQIDDNQRELGKQITAARVAAKQGDLLEPQMQDLVRRNFVRIFAGTEGAARRASVMDENPLDIRLTVNQRYPDDVPLSTMPPEVLQILPKMPEELEYRFVGRYLVIMDAHAHLIADFIPNAIPD